MYDGAAQHASCAYKFTGDERDSETSLDHTWFRQYSSSLDRWMHPDPAGLAAVDITNPQSWNRYSYASNRPLNYVDPSGLTDCPQGKTCGDLWDILGGGNFWDGRPYIGIGGGGFGGVGNQFSLLNIPIVVYGWIPYPSDLPGAGVGDLPPGESATANTYLYWGPIQVGSGLDLNIGSGTVRATPKLKFKPPSWQNFTHEFLPCYGAQLLDNFVGSDDKAGITAGTVALAVAKPKLGGPLLVLWAPITGPEAGAACAFASRAVYE